MDRAEYVAIVEPVSVGGVENTAPTPVPPLTPYPTPPFVPVTPTPVPSDILTGIGATLIVVDDFAGNSPQQFAIDRLHRKRVEEGLRALASNPGYVAPCPVDFLVPRWTPGQKYVVVAGYWDGEDEVSTLLRFPVEGDRLLLASSEGDWWQLAVTATTHQTYFSDLRFDSWGELENGTEIGLIHEVSIPLSKFRAAVQSIVNSELPAVAATSTPIASTNTVITPPDTGDAGLR